MIASGKVTYANDKLEASLESNDTITGLGVDTGGQGVVGTVTAQVSFTLTPSADIPFFWDRTAPRAVRAWICRNQPRRMALPAMER